MDKHTPSGDKSSAPPARVIAGPKMDTPATDNQVSVAEPSQELSSMAINYPQLDMSESDVQRLVEMEHRRNARISDVTQSRRRLGLKKTSKAFRDERNEPKEESSNQQTEEAAREPREKEGEDEDAEEVLMAQMEMERKARAAAAANGIRDIFVKTVADNNATVYKWLDDIPGPK